MALPRGLEVGLQIGASVSVSGVCLTAVQIHDTQVSFDVIEESLDKTTLGTTNVGTRLNIERAATFGSEIGGHLLSGHIAGRAEVVESTWSNNSLTLKIRPDSELLRYIFTKGFIGVDGVSLTVGVVDNDAGMFSVHLIPETLRMTTLGSNPKLVNLEIDAMTQAVVDTVERMLSAQKKGES